MNSQDDYRRQESELDDLYKEIILDHYRNPRHRGSLTEPSASHEGLNPLCGDEVTVDIAISDGGIADIAYRGSGCSICRPK